MKKILALLCVLTFCLGVASALAAEYTVPGMFAVTYDDSLLQPNDPGYAEDGPEEGSHSIWLFSLSNDDIVFEAETEELDNEFSDLTLFAVSPEDIQAYIDYFLETYAYENARYHQTILTDKEQIPFCLYTLADDEGDYYYAETVIGGRSIGFYGYYTELDRAPDSALDELYFDFLKSFTLEK